MSPLKLAGLGLAVAVCLTLSGCSGCDEHLRLRVFAGDIPEADCAKLYSQGVQQEIVLTCPRNPVTIYWDFQKAKTDRKITLDDGSGRAAEVDPKEYPIGRRVVYPAASTTIIATAVGSCAGEQKAKVEVVTGDQIREYPANWDFVRKNSLGQPVLRFEVYPYFIDPKIRVVGIQAKFQPVIDDYGSTCIADPLLIGDHNGFGFEIHRPYVTETTKFIALPQKPAGPWVFSWNEQCFQFIPFPNEESIFAQQMDYIFLLTLRCY